MPWENAGLAARRVSSCVSALPSRRVCCGDALEDALREVLVDVMDMGDGGGGATLRGASIL